MLLDSQRLWCGGVVWGWGEVDSGITGLMRVVWPSSTAISNSSSSHRRRNILRRQMGRGLWWKRAHVLLRVLSLETRNICSSNCTNIYNGGRELLICKPTQGRRRKRLERKEIKWETGAKSNWGEKYEDKKRWMKKSSTAKDSGITICTRSLTETIAFSLTLNWETQRTLCHVLHNIENKNGPHMRNNNLHAICLWGHLSCSNMLIVKTHVAALVCISHIISCNATYKSRMLEAGNRHHAFYSVLCIRLASLAKFNS